MVFSLSIYGRKTIYTDLFSIPTCAHHQVEPLKTYQNVEPIPPLKLFLVKTNGKIVEDENRG